MIYIFLITGCAMLSVNIIAHALVKHTPKSIGEVLRFVPLAGIIYEYFFVRNIHISKAVEMAGEITGRSGRKNKKEIRDEQIRRISAGLRIVFAGNLICAALCFFSQGEDGHVITRPDYEEGAKTIDLEFDIEGLKKDVGMELEIEPVKSSKEDFDKLLDELREYLIKTVKGDNAGLDDVYLPLDLVEEYPENDKVEISWLTDEEGYIDSQGNIEGVLPGESVIVRIDAMISYEDHRADIPIDLKLVYHEKDMEGHVKEYLKNYVKEQCDAGAETIELPQEVDGAKLDFHKDKEEYRYLCLFLVITVCAAAFAGAGERNVVRQASKIREKLRLEYPDMVKEFLLLLKAGLNVPIAFEKLAFENEGQVYEFMRSGASDMKNGADVRECIRKFGKRCQLDEYSRFCAYIVQNIDKGSEKIISVLESESEKAGSMEKNAVYKAGERAGEKMVFPLIVLLILVIFIAVYPALAVM